jgi:hypothetical protein
LEVFQQVKGNGPNHILRQSKKHVQVSLGSFFYLHSHCSDSTVYAILCRGLKDAPKSDCEWLSVVRSQGTSTFSQLQRIMSAPCKADSLASEIAGDNDKCHMYKYVYLDMCFE